MKVYSDLDLAMQSMFEATTAKTIEPFNDQYRNTATEHAKPYPAIYYELLEPVSWNQSGNQFQQAKMRARIHCVVFDLKTTKEKIHNFAQEVFMKAHQVKLYDDQTRELTSEWVRMGSSMQKRFKNLKVITIDFEFEGFDYSTLPTNLEGPISFNVVIPQ